jgi:hypothetical protein
MTAAFPPFHTAAASTVRLYQQFVDVLSSPGDVFEEIASTPPRPATWRAPLLLLCLTTVILAGFPISSFQATAVQILAQSAGVASSDLPGFSGNFRLISALISCAASLAGTFWSALMLWFIARAILQRRVSYAKVLEVAGLANFIVILDCVVSAVLQAILELPDARPAASLLLPELPPHDRLRAILDTFNLFHLWGAALLSFGLSKLSAASFKECAFWVFGWCVVLKTVICLLGVGP